MSLKFLLIICVSLGIAHTSIAAAVGRGSPRTAAGLPSRSDSSHSLDSLDSDDSPRALHLPALQRRYNNKLAEMQEVLRQTETNTHLLQAAIARSDQRWQTRRWQHLSQLFLNQYIQRGFSLGRYKIN